MPIGIGEIYCFVRWHAQHYIWHKADKTQTGEENEEKKKESLLVANDRGKLIRVK